MSDENVSCPKCGATFQFEKRLVPTKVSCADCDHKFVVDAKEIVPGTVLAGYRIERLLGKGGMGEVHLATQISMDRDVALKILKPTITQDPEDVEAFIREARLLAKLDHPNIVTAFDFGEAMGVYYLAMAYVEGEDLADRLEREGMIEEKESIDIIIKVARALSYAWDKHHLLHRDINPANIMIDKYGDVRIMDLGIGKTMGDEGSASSDQLLVGTPNYMSSEQAIGDEKIDFRSDMYSLGATLHYMVTGEIPFDDPDPHKILEKQRYSDLAPAIKLNPAVSAECSGLIKVMMAKARNDRFTSWDECIAKMDEVVKSAGQRAKSGATTVRPRPAGSGRRKSSTKLGAPRKPSVKIPPERLIPPRKKSNNLIGWIIAALVLAAAYGGYRVYQQEEIKKAAIRKQEEERLAKEKDQENQRLEVLGRRFAAATAGLQAEPPDYREVLRRLNQLIPEAAGTEFEEQIDEKIAVIKIEMASVPPPPPPPPPPDRNFTVAMKSLCEKLAAPILRQEFAAAKQLLNAAMQKNWPNEHVQDLQAMSATITEVAKINDLIVGTFEKDLGKEMIVSLAAGPEKLRISGTHHAGVEAEIILRSEGKTIGAVRRDFDIADLALDAKFDRIGRQTTDQAIMRAVAAVESDDLDSAREQLADLEHPLAQVLVDGLDALKPTPEPAPAPEPEPESGPETDPATVKPSAETAPEVSVIHSTEQFIGLRPVASARINDQQADAAFGSDPGEDLSVYHFAREENRSLLRFDLGPVSNSKPIKKAELILEAKTRAGRNNGETMTVHFVTASWAESNVTWKQASSVKPWQNAGGDFREQESAYSTSDANTGDEISWDVTEMVKAWMSGTPNHGLLMQSSHEVGGNGLQFYRSENKRLRVKGPRLEITYN